MKNIPSSTYSFANQSMSLNREENEIAPGNPAHVLEAISWPTMKFKNSLENFCVPKQGFKQRVSTYLKTLSKQTLFIFL